MKNLFVFVFALFALAGCNSKDVEPIHAGEALAGTYSVTSFLFTRGDSTYHLPTLPYTVQGSQIITGKLEVTRLEAMNQVSLKLTLQEPGEPDAVFPIDNVEVRPDGDEYDLHVGSTQLATADGTTVDFDVTTRDSQTGESIVLKFEAKR
ncbi:hypothetical protein [Spirosoma sp. KUDC1026]|uniref:hypothetical protein n=1 Tax=Spirosoma sp. KUDC1026 TaxID=2745947 RepID=UPI00159BA996|nr:hypothetical protein [Spirosoma sp. KUDC1026]QKZ15425.1 hypothetical protein HU175_23520 [Spirosoma sp. KUDC1026]